jgi:hypothetical protein
MRFELAFPASKATLQAPMFRVFEVLFGKWISETGLKHLFCVGEYRSNPDHSETELWLSYREPIGTVYFEDDADAILFKLRFSEYIVGDDQ